VGGELVPGRHPVSRSVSQDRQAGGGVRQARCRREVRAFRQQGSQRAGERVTGARGIAGETRAIWRDLVLAVRMEDQDPGSAPGDDERAGAMVEELPGGGAGRDALRTRSEYPRVS